MFCGTLLRFDFRRRLVFGLLMGLLFTTSLGIAVACMLFRVSPWIWIIPLFVASIFAFVFVVRHGDRVAVAAPAFSATKDGSHGLPNDAQSGMIPNRASASKLTWMLRVVVATQARRRWSASIGLAAITLVTVIVLCSSSHPAEPEYRGVGLSQWLETTRVRPNAASVEEMVVVLKSVGPEAVPWLIRFLGQREGVLDKGYLLLYQKWLYRYRSRWLPQPRLFRFQGARFNGVDLLSRLAPGTAFENRAVDVLLSFEHIDDSTFKNQLFRCLGSFTNSSQRVMPMLLIGVTNPATFDASLKGLQSFGADAAPALYRMAQRETGHIRPAELALEKIDEGLYLQLLDEKAKRKLR